MMRLKSALIILVLLSGAALSAEEMSIVRHVFYMNTGDPESAVRCLRGFSEKNSGYVQYYSNKKMVLRIKKGAAGSLRACLSGTGFIIDEQVYRRSVTGTVVELRTKLRVKEKLLRDLYDLFNTSAFHQALDVEKEIGRQILEIEKLKGQLAWYRDRTSLDSVTVMFSGIQTAGKHANASTRWGWIRKLGIPGLIQSWETP